MFVNYKQVKQQTTQQRKNTMKYNAKQMNDGNFAVFTGKQYFTDTITSNERDAHVRALQLSAQWHQEQIDKAMNELDKLGAIDPRDPKGFLA